MNELRIFSNPLFGDVRTVTIDGKPMFCLTDVCNALEINKTSDVKARLREDGVVLNDITDRLGRKQSALFISEGNLYRAVFQSRKPKAEEFTDWITDEVIPTLRETGEYSIKGKKPDSYTIEDKVERAKRWIEEQEESRREKQVLEEKVSVLEPDASAFQALCDSKLLTNFRDGAKELGMSQSQLIGWLKREKYIYSTSKGELRPMEAYRKSDLFRMKSYTNPNNGFAGIQTYLTPKGLQYFKMQLEARGIMPDALPKHGGRNGKKRR